jgi:DNA polymerase I-like protein with 3'-5' exonuclease and polymerase domains
VVKLRAIEGIEVTGFTHDTNLSEYLRFSDVKAYGLENTAERRFPRFSGYKTVIVDDLSAGVEMSAKLRTAGDKYKFLSDNGYFHMSRLSLETLRLYNGGDADLTKRIETGNKKYIPQSLMSMYIDFSFLLQEMEPQGPFFDYEQHAKLSELYPYMEKKLRLKSQEEAGDPEFNPGSPQQVVDVLYSKDKLGLKYPFHGKPNSQKMTMLVLGREHPFPLTVLEWRSVSKVKGTYLDSYEECARANGDRLRTRWWATGARTGRMSSGGSKEKKKTDVKVINLQNIKKDAHMQNMCVADRRWRRVYDKITSLLRGYGEVDAHWQRLEKWERYVSKCRKRGKAPDPAKKPGLSETAKAQFARMAKRLEAWIRENIPDFKTYLIFDYGQVEIRVAAQIAGDKQLTEDCTLGDIHTTVGVGLTGWDADLIKNDDFIRTMTKNMHFGMLFGASKESLFQFVIARTPPDMRDYILGVFAARFPGKDPEEAWREQVEDAYDKYFARYRKIKRMIDRLRSEALENGYAMTLFGMFQTLNATDESFDDSRDFGGDEDGDRDSYWGNQAINGPIQGTAHQLMICALVNLVRKSAVYAMLGIPPMEVHDALYFAINVLDIHEAWKKGKYLLEQESLNTVASDFPNIKWQVPIEVDAKAGVRLGGKVKVDEHAAPGEFLMRWYYVTRQQERALDSELSRVMTA